MFQGDTEHGLDGPVVRCVGHLPSGQEMEVEQIEQRTNRHRFQYHPKIDQKFINSLTHSVCSSARNINVILNFWPMSRQYSFVQICFSFSLQCNIIILHYGKWNALITVIISLNNHIFTANIVPRPNIQVCSPPPSPGPVLKWINYFKHVLKMG